jgi:hypothetical protein
VLKYTGKPRDFLKKTIGILICFRIVPTSKHKTVKPPSSVLFIESNEGTTTPLSMDWISSDDNEDSSFTLVESRKKKNMKRKSSISTSRPITRSQRNKKVESTNCALSPGKVSRTRSKPKKLQ